MNAPLARRGRKRERRALCLAEPSAEALHRAADEIRAGSFAEALGRLNALAGVDERPAVRGRIAALVADLHVAAGRFDEASEAYRTAAPMFEGESRDWARPRLGRIAALLKGVRVAEAAAEAEAVWQESLARHEAWRRMVTAATASIGQGHAVAFDGLPARPSVVGTRLARLFMSEGEPQFAREFLERAIAHNPMGACRARMALAELSLREGHPAHAKQHAREALIVGRFQAKTIAAWRLLIVATGKLGESGVAPDLLSGLMRAKPAIRARAVLEMVKALRAQRMPLWVGQANAWLASGDRECFPEIAADLLKMQLAEHRASKSDSAATQDAAAALLRVPNLSAFEWMAAAKELVRVGALDGTTSLHTPLLDHARERFGAAFVPVARHAFALASQAGRQLDPARDLLEQNLTDPTVPAVDRQKALWALARLEAVAHRDAESAARWLQLADEPSLPDRFRAQALRRGVHALQNARDTEALPAAVARLEPLVTAMQDWRAIFDVLRQVRHLRARTGSWVSVQTDRAHQLARHAFAQARTPDEARRILLHAFRRLALDLGRPRAVVDWWETVTPFQRNWMWTAAEPFWELLATVHDAARRCDAHACADALVTTYLEDAATPPTGTIWLGMARARWQWTQDAPKAALEFARWAVREHGQHTQVAPAHYWLALAAAKRGDNAARDASCQAALRALGSSVGLRWQWELQGKVHLLLAGIEPESVSRAVSNHDAATLQRLARGVRQELDKVP
jgi:tetratricopeptide (TPR) repeat protein